MVERRSADGLPRWPVDCDSASSAVVLADDYARFEPLWNDE